MGAYAQPTADTFAKFARAGYRSVLNLRLKNEDGFLGTEQQLAEKNGMKYAHAPFAPSPVDMAVRTRGCFRAPFDLPD
jgi:protein tyrosine phosphatase (PTP) superfamily phosphohydrolase (DUF442 family)